MKTKDAEIANLRHRIAALEMRLATLEARPLTMSFPVYGNSPPANPQCPYCYKPISQCRGHAICNVPTTTVTGGFYS